jgi:hypothetical protein
VRVLRSTQYLLIHHPIRASTDAAPLLQTISSATGRFSTTQLRASPKYSRLFHGFVIAAQKNVETVLREIQVEAEAYPERHRQLMAVRYYLHTMLWRLGVEWKKQTSGVTNYKSLLDEIAFCNKSNDLVCLVTFNYDTLLDDALAELGLKRERMDDYISRHPVYRLFKLHGSVNWARIVKGGIEYASDNARAVGYQHIELADRLLITDEFVISQSYPVGLISRANYSIALVPAIAVPVEQKAYFECPVDHLRQLEQVLPETNRLMLIGWRATEDHFLQVLRNRLPRNVSLLVVGKDQADAQVIGQNFMAALPGTTFKAQFAPHGFTDLVVNLRARNFLLK